MAGKHGILWVFFAMLLAVPAGTGHAQSSEDETAEEFFHQRRNDLIAEYYRCTGDSSQVAAGRILAWKEGINAWSQTMQFDSVYRAFIEETDAYGEDIKPCDVYAWFVAQRKEKQNDSASTEDALEARRKMVRDSTTIFRESTTLARTPFDFDSIQFLVSRLTFNALFTQRNKSPLHYDGERILVKNVKIGTGSFFGSFEFGGADKLYRYELQSASFPADLLDTQVRALADTLSAMFEPSLGPAGHQYRVGFFDIIQGRLEPYKTWYTREHSVVVGYGTYKHRYYVKAIVTCAACLAEHRNYIPPKPSRPQRARPPRPGDASPNSATYRGNRS